MKEKLKLYYVDMKYIRALQSVDDKGNTQTQQTRKSHK